jgi:DNA-binding NarL/FixJ family response regulator
MEPLDVVVLLWDHPLLLSEFERALEGSRFRVEGYRFEARMAPDLKNLAIPNRSLFAVGGALSRSATEQIVGWALSRNTESRVLVLAESFSESIAFPLLRLGVNGLLTYSEMALRLPWALAEVSQGGYWVPRALLSRFVETVLANAASKTPPADVGALTRREQEVMTSLLNNSSNKEIATRLRISERTAKFHVSNVLAKYGVRRRADLILLAYSAPKES